MQLQMDNIVWTCIHNGISLMMDIMLVLSILILINKGHTATQKIMDIHVYRVMALIAIESQDKIVSIKKCRLALQKINLLATLIKDSIAMQMEFNGVILKMIIYNIVQQLTI